MAYKDQSKAAAYRIKNREKIAKYRQDHKK